MDNVVPCIAVVLSIIAIVFSCIALHRQLRIVKYTYLANKWYDIKDREFENPEFTEQAKTSTYKTSFSGKLLREYEIFAWICWGHAEDIWANKWNDDAGFRPSIKRYKKLHYEWLKETKNSENFRDEFCPIGALGP